MGWASFWPHMTWVNQKVLNQMKIERGLNFCNQNSSYQLLMKVYNSQIFQRKLEMEKTIDEITNIAVAKVRVWKYRLFEF